MGLGDMILCNAIIRNICKHYEQVVAFVKPEYSQSISFMYRDLKNLELITINEVDIDNILSSVDIDNKIWVGFGNIEHLLEAFRFDECFYKQVGLKFDRRWSDFYVDRDLKEEKKLLERFNLKPGEYIFVHDDSIRGYNISDRFFSSDLQIFRPDQSEQNIFNYCTILENAKEIHVMDSCFKHVADSLYLTNDLFYHVYVRGTGNHHVTNSRNSWRYIF
jgi:hypothetical protein